MVDIKPPCIQYRACVYCTQDMVDTEPLLCNYVSITAKKFFVFHNKITFFMYLAQNNKDGGVFE